MRGVWFGVLLIAGCPGPASVPVQETKAVGPTRDVARLVGAMCELDGLR